MVCFRPCYPAESHPCHATLRLYKLSAESWDVCVCCSTSYLLHLHQGLREASKARPQAHPERKFSRVREADSPVQTP